MKVGNYIFILTGIILLFEIMGIDTTLDNLALLIGYSNGTFNFSVSSFFDAVLSNAGVLLAIIGGIVVGISTRSSPENFIILPFITGTLALFVQAFTAIISYALGNFEPWVYSIFLIILAPLLVLYVFSLVEFFRGTD